MSTAIAWALASTESGGTEYQILVVDDLIVVGWGSLDDDSRQYQVSAAISPEEAQRFAVSQTGAKESRGYVMSKTPVSAPLEPVHLDYLRTKVGTHGRDDNLKAGMTKILGQGTPL